MKGSLKVAAFEDGAFPTSKRGKCLLLGVLTSNSTILKVSLSLITVDGLDATKKLVEMVEPWKEETDLIMLSSLAYAGFNVMDPEEIYSRLKTPILVVLSRRPRRKAVEKALKKHFQDWKVRLEILRKVEKVSSMKLPSGKTYFSAFGMKPSEAEEILRKLTFFGGKPEPLRAAKLLVQGLGYWKG